MRDMTKKLNIFTLIRIGNLDWCKCRRCKNEAREIDCLGCREVDAMLIASTIVTRARGNHLAVRDLWATARLLVTRVSLIYLVDWFFFFPGVPERLGVVGWDRQSYLGPDEIASFFSRDFSQSNNDTFWHVVSTVFFYVLFSWTIAVSDFRPWKFLWKPRTSHVYSPHPQSNF